MTTRQLLLLGASVLPYGCAAPAEAYLLNPGKGVSCGWRNWRSIPLNSTATRRHRKKR
jgi:hypothetical protein